MIKASIHSQRSLPTMYNKHDNIHAGLKERAIPP